MADTNYTSGDDYIVEFLGYRFTFNTCDFEQRVVAAAAKLGLVEANELDEDETNDLVALAAQGLIDEPESRLGRYLAAQLGARLARRRRVARLLAPQARLPRRLARPPGEARRARGRVGRDRGRVRLPASRRPPAAARARPGAVVARAPVPRLTRSPSEAPITLATVRRPALLIAYLAALLAVDHFASYPEQLALGVLTWARPDRRGCAAFDDPQGAGDRRVVFATVGELTGSIIWGVYRYRLHNLPLFVPPAHGLVFLTGLSIAAARGPARDGRSSSPRRRSPRPGACSGCSSCRAATSRARSACRCSCSSSGARAAARSTRASSWSSPASSSTAPRSGRGAGRRRSRGSGSPTATRRRASPRATSGST